MAHTKNHDYHILPPSIWPLVAAVGAFLMLYGGILWMKEPGSIQLGLLSGQFGRPIVFTIGVLTVFYSMFGWWGAVIHEGNAGEHTPVIRIGLRYGMILFIVSEVMFFVAWFWNFIKHALYPMGPMSPLQDGVWPPAGIETFDPFHLPLINTLILLCSGAAVTWAHHALAHENNRRDLVNGLVLGVALGALFTLFQAYEYAHAAFGFSGNIYGASFFMATGFHGFHVIIGTIFLAVCLIRAIRGDFTPKEHIGFEAAAWYWHFVDVVWLFLFAVIYMWGSA